MNTFLEQYFHSLLYVKGYWAENPSNAEHFKRTVERTLGLTYTSYNLTLQNSNCTMTNNYIFLIKINSE